MEIQRIVTVIGSPQYWGEPIVVLHLSDTTWQEQQATQARRLALLTEKSELQQAERSGLLDEEDLWQLVEKVDTQLAELPKEHGGH